MDEAEVTGQKAVSPGNIDHNYLLWSTHPTLGCLLPFIQET